MGYVQSTINAQRVILQAIEDAILHFYDPSDTLLQTNSSIGFDSLESL